VLKKSKWCYPRYTQKLDKKEQIYSIPKPKKVGDVRDIYIKHKNHDGVLYRKMSTILSLLIVDVLIADVRTPVSFM